MLDCKELPDKGRFEVLSPTLSDGAFKVEDATNPGARFDDDCTTLETADGADVVPPTLPPTTIGVGAAPPVDEVGKLGAGDDMETTADVGDVGILLD